MARRVNPERFAVVLRRRYRDLDQEVEPGRRIRIRERLRAKLMDLEHVDNRHAVLDYVAQFAEDTDDPLRRLAVERTTEGAIHALDEGDKLDAEREPRGRRAFTLEKLRRNRAFRQKVRDDGEVVFEPTAQPSLDPDMPAPARLEHHDILVVAPEGVHGEDQFYRFPVRKPRVPIDTDAVQDELSHQGVGTYTRPPELLDSYDYSQRRVLGIARPQARNHDGELNRGPAFATLPIKQEPAATSCIACYLLNTQNLNYRNPWIAEEWNDRPGGEDLPPATGHDSKRVEVLLAGPRGRVFRVEIDGLDQWQAYDSVEGKVEDAPSAQVRVECVDLKRQVEVWRQLRNGSVMARVRVDDETVPLVNITTLTPDVSPNRTTQVRQLLDAQGGGR